MICSSHIYGILKADDNLKKEKNIALSINICIMLYIILIIIKM
jgi:hypothetical protein